MVKSNLYTRTGDTGDTSLVDGSRVRKDSVRLEAYGTLDDLSSKIGVILSSPDCPEEIKGQLKEIQNRMFDFGSYLATPVAGDATPSAGNLEPAIARLEGWIDLLDEQTPKVRAFILPGGCPLSAQAHVARTACRTTERRIITLADQCYVDPALIRYINRLSDYLFILARYFNFINGIEEIIWQKQ